LNKGGFCLESPSFGGCMSCKHLIKLEEDIIRLGIVETFRGKAWTENCNEWIYFDCYLETESLCKKYDFASCVIEHTNEDPRSGAENGFVCIECKDAIMGYHKMQINEKTKIIK